jgi:hypothetical protein
VGFKVSHDFESDVTLRFDDVKNCLDSKEEVSFLMEVALFLSQNIWLLALLTKVYVMEDSEATTCRKFRIRI